MKSLQKPNVIIFSLVAVNLALFSFWFLPKDKIAEGTYSEIEEIKGQNWDFRQMSSFFTQLAQARGGEYAYKALTKAAMQSYVPLNIDLHLLGHVVGDELFKQQGLEGIKVCTDDLRNACSHSIVVGFLLEEGATALGRAVETCKEAPGGKGAYTMCVHGLGHGVLAYTEYNMKLAVEMCANTDPRGQGEGPEVIECIGGVTMEMMAGVHDREVWQKQAPNYFKKEDPLSPCSLSFMPEFAAPMCYTYLTPHLFEAAGANLSFPDPKYYEKAFSFCQAIPKSKPADRNSCYASFGKEFVVLANNRNIQNSARMTDEQLNKIHEWCDFARNEEGVRACTNSALQSMYWGGENERGGPIRFCDLITSASEEQTCFDSLIGAVNYYVSDIGYRREFCNEIPEIYLNQCNSRLNLN